MVIGSWLYLYLQFTIYEVIPARHRKGSSKAGRMQDLTDNQVPYLISHITKFKTENRESVPGNPCHHPFVFHRKICIHEASESEEQQRQLLPLNYQQWLNYLFAVKEMYFIYLFM